MSKVVSIDLEMDQPSGKIIQIGYVIGDVITRRIFLEKSIIVNSHTQLGMMSNKVHISDFTGITQKMVDNGVELSDAYQILCEDIIRLNPTRTPLQWGSGDSRALREELGIPYNDFIFRGREFDAKTLYQVYRMFNRKSVVSGLSGAMSKVGIPFTGRPHNALDDAKNTFYIFAELGKRLKNYGVI